MDKNGLSLVVQTVENPPAMRETWVWSLGWEDPLEEETDTHSSILAQRIPWTEEPGELQSVGSQWVGHNQVTKRSTGVEIHVFVLPTVVSRMFTDYVSEPLAEWYYKHLVLGYCVLRASLVARMVKNLPVVWETWVWSLGWEDPLEEGMTTYSIIPAWRIPMDYKHLVLGHYKPLIKWSNGNTKS